MIHAQLNSNHCIEGDSIGSGRTGVGEPYTTTPVSTPTIRNLTCITSQSPTGTHGPSRGLTISNLFAAMQAVLSTADLGRLKWRCRRGLLENDLFVERFFRRHEAGLTLDQVHGLQGLMDLSDNDLLDLLLARKEPEGDLDRPEVKQVLALMREPG